MNQRLRTANFLYLFCSDAVNKGRRRCKQRAVTLHAKDRKIVVYGGKIGRVDVQLIGYTSAMKQKTEDFTPAMKQN